MEQESTQKPWGTILAAVTLLICFLFGALLTNGASAPVSGMAVLDGSVEMPDSVAAVSLTTPKTVVPLGRAVGGFLHFYYRWG